MHRHEIIVDDSLCVCPYLPQERARMPLRLPLERLTPQRLDDALAAGDRRSGVFLYRTKCPDCRACEAIRLDVNEFKPSRSQRRVARRAEQKVRVEVQACVADAERVHLYNEHRRQRGLALRDDDIELSSYDEFLVSTCCETVELEYRVGSRLVGVGVTDRGQNALSAVYFYFDPQFSRLSLGVYNIIRQVELCREWNMRYLYLGYYIGACRHMSYKSGYLPHERLIDGRWVRFEKGEREGQK